MIGEWLRQQPVALKLGSVLFVHGGVSPQVARTGLTVDQLNAAMQDYWNDNRSEEHTSELQSLMRISYAVFCLKKKKNKKYNTNEYHTRQLNCLQQNSNADITNTTTT